MSDFYKAVYGVLTLVIAFCLFIVIDTASVSPGEEMVFVKKPVLFGGAGIDDEILKEGRAFYATTTTAVRVSVVPQTASINFDDISTKDNILLDFTSSVTYQVIDSRKFIVFCDHWWENNIAAQYSAIVRSAVKKYSFTEIMSDVEKAKLIDSEVTEQLIALVAETKLPIKIINISLGRARPNQNVLEQMDKTAAEQQRQKTLTEQIISEEKRKIAEGKRAEADMEYAGKMHMNTEQFVALETAKMYSTACKTSANCIILNGNATPVLPLSK